MRRLKTHGPMLLFYVLSLALGAIGIWGHTFGSSSHSLSYLQAGVSESSQELTQFMSLEYLDGQLISPYDSQLKKVLPLVPWLEEGHLGGQYLDRLTWQAQDDQEAFQKDLQKLRDSTNTTQELLTWQCTYGCDLDKDGHRGGHLRYGYNAAAFISFSLETFSWRPESPKAEHILREWEAQPSRAAYWRTYLEDVCAERLGKYLDSTKGIRPKIEAPTVKVTRKMGSDGLETLTCRLDGFYPKEIKAMWRKNGEVWEQETPCGDIVPNSDGTYHGWLSIRVEPEEKRKYKCHVEHDGLSERLQVAGCLWDCEHIFVLSYILLQTKLLFFIVPMAQNNRYVMTGTILAVGAIFWFGNLRQSWGLTSVGLIYVTAVIFIVSITLWKGNIGLAHRDHQFKRNLLAVPFLASTLLLVADFIFLLFTPEYCIPSFSSILSYTLVVMVLSGVELLARMLMLLQLFLEAERGILCGNEIFDFILNKIMFCDHFLIDIAKAFLLIIWSSTINVECFVEGIKAFAILTGTINFFLLAIFCFFEKPHECLDCRMKFRRSLALLRHLREHTEEKTN